MECDFILKEIKNKVKESMIVGTYIVLLAFLLINLKGVTMILGNIMVIIKPIIIALAMAFVLNILMRIFENKIFFFLDKQKSEFLRKLKRPLSILATFLFVIGMMVGITLFVIPQFIESLSTLIDAVPGYLNSFEAMIDKHFSSIEVMKAIQDSVIDAWKEVFQIAGQLIGKSLTGILSVTVNITNMIFNFVVALVLAIYLLANKEKLILQSKKLLYAFLKKDVVDKILEVGRLTNVTFSSFIGGQCTEAIILGILCFIGMNIFKMPYALLISVLISVTSLIPVFGAFIGTIPAVFIILIISPIKAIWFVIFIIVLQQLEGNIIYPKVVGSSVGLSAIWVMVAITVGGSAFGLIGMLIGVPTVSVIYQLVRNATNNKLNKKGIRVK
ncbi:putative membrane protein [Clostridium bornimense]|uniref:Putative membrane protein n=1 Tax=Clostridium bornimense TaxID=1216932 RepID=W6RVM4_9CLOT|nr:putative membrane protein [Clostridium bornimense]